MFPIAGSDIPSGYTFVQTIRQFFGYLGKQGCEAIALCHLPTLAVPTLRTAQLPMNIFGSDGFRERIAAFIAAKEKFLVGIGLFFLQHLYWFAIPFLIPELSDPGLLC